jgi:[ribosomal protein S5]-alanine N-acetyltransferase
MGEAWWVVGGCLGGVGMELTTERLILRPFREDDFPEVFAYRSDERVMRYLGGEAESEADVLAFIQRTAEYAMETPPRRCRFAIVLRETGAVIGGCGLDVTSADFRDTEIGYHLHADHWGAGYGTEVAHALIDFCFRELGMHRVWADCVAENVGSSRVMEKAGMRREAQFVRNRFLEGRWHDTLVYAILEDEWPGSG